MEVLLEFVTAQALSFVPHPIRQLTALLMLSILPVPFARCFAANNTHADRSASIPSLVYRVRLFLNDPSWLSDILSTVNVVLSYTAFRGKAVPQSLATS